MKAVEKAFLTTGEIAGALGVTSQAIREWARLGRIRHIKPAKLILIPKTELERLLNTTATPKAGR